MSVPRLELITWHYEMFAPPPGPPRPAPDGLEIVHVPRIPIHFYRYLYETIGKPWCWWERRRQSDAEIAAEVHRPDFEVHVPYVDMLPMGLVEIDKRRWPEAQLNYFGIFDEYTRRGIGGHLLDWSARRMFGAGATRYWLHTCSLDSPNAVHAYERAGFQRFDTVVSTIDDPRAPG